MRKYIGNKAFFQEAIHVALPMMLQNLVSTCVNLIDSLMVGQLGDAAIGGVASVNRFYLIGNYGTMGIINAVGIFIAQFSLTIVFLCVIIIPIKIFLSEFKNIY